MAAAAATAGTAAASATTTAPAAAGSTAAPAASQPSQRLLVIDTDVGCDDAVAILLAARDPTTRLLALTTVFGNVTMAQATDNACTLLPLFGYERSAGIKVHAGCAAPWLSTVAPTPWPGHGANGLGDAVFDVSADRKLPVETEHAALALCRYARQHKGELHVIALGPLTNLALASKLDPDFLGNLASLVVMGGAISGRGNASFMAEFNFASDAEAANAVLNACPSPITLVTWDLAEHSPLSWADFDALTRSKNPETFEAKFVRETSAKYEQMLRGTHFGAHVTAGGGSSGGAKALTGRELMRRLQTRTLTAAATATAVDCNGGSVANPNPKLVLPAPAPSDAKAGGPATTAASASAPQHAAPHTVSEGLGAAAASTTPDAAYGVNPHQYIPCDAYAVAIWLHPELVRTAQLLAAVVECTPAGSGSHARGAVAFDWYGTSERSRANTPNVLLPLALHTHRFVDLLMRRIRHGTRAPIDFDAKMAADVRKAGAAAEGINVLPPHSVSHPVSQHSPNARFEEH